MVYQAIFTFLALDFRLQILCRILHFVCGMVIDVSMLKSILVKESQIKMSVVHAETCHQLISERERDKEKQNTCTLTCPH